MSVRAALVAGESRLYLRLRAMADRRGAQRTLRRGEAPRPAHLLTGVRGEELACAYLRRLGYTVVARRWFSARVRGDLDLVAWDGDTLVIVEVKTRTAHDFAPAATAVNGAKQAMLRRLALAYRGRLPEPWRDHVPLRFDVLSVYDLPGGPEFDHLRSAFSLHAPARGW